MSELGKLMWQVSCSCRGDAALVRQVDLLGSGRVIGLFALDQVLDQVYAAGKPPSEAVGQELLTLIRRFNYVPPHLEEAYAAGLLRLYSQYWREREVAK